MLNSNQSPFVSAAGDYVLEIEPEEGGALARFDWRGVNIFRPRCGAGPLNSACFPLAPFSNRIARGKFECDGAVVQLSPNFPAGFHPHCIHGFAWLAPWRVEARSSRRFELAFEYAAGEWPWDFTARQTFTLSPAGLRHDISIRNLSDRVMPAGLGAHPYFPTSPQARYHGLHLGEWETSSDGLPFQLHLRRTPRDWWRGAPLASRHVDTVYVGRSSPLTLTWPERGLRLCISPCPALSFTAIFTPKGADYFCVEPISHQTDAVNAAGADTGLRWLAPGENFAVSIDYAATSTERD